MTETYLLHEQRLLDEAATAGLGVRLSGLLGGGDTVLISGPMGAGKSALSRALIREWVGEPALEVPSPSYTLVNVYQASAGEIWHADLYRVSDSGDIVELGLEDAMDHALVLIEWPDRLENLPDRHLAIELAYEGVGRRVSLSVSGRDWDRVRQGFGAAA